MQPMAKGTRVEGPLAGPALAKHTRILAFALLSVVPLLFVWGAMRSLAAITLRSDTYSHLPLIPLISLFFVYSARGRIFAKPASGWKLGSMLVLAGIACFALSEFNRWHSAPENSLSIAMLGVALGWAGGFALLFGTEALRAASFPFLFLVFMIPIPEPLLGRTVLLLQQGSADAASMFFKLFGVPMLREGLDFKLPGVAIRVADECSGIRSTLALLIMAVLAGHMFLRSLWRKSLLCFMVFPVALIKNGLRIAALSSLAVYVDPGFLHGRLHRNGGIAFFAVGLIPLGLFLIWFQKMEKEK